MMRTLEAIEKDLSAAREALSSAEGTPAEVYSRIVGYYRSVRNWNKGKREEYRERKLFCVSTELPAKFPAANTVSAGTNPLPGSFPLKTGLEQAAPETGDARLLLFVRTTCPACPSAKAAAGRLGIPVALVNADTADGLAEAQRYNVFATPTAILFNGEGREIERARDSQGIAALDRLVAV
jgi:ribonucleoside-triphosphate reductase